MVNEFYESSSSVQESLMPVLVQAAVAQAAIAQQQQMLFAQQLLFDHQQPPSSETLADISTAQDRRAQREDGLSEEDLELRRLGDEPLAGRIEREALAEQIERVLQRKSEKLEMPRLGGEQREASRMKRVTFNEAANTVFSVTPYGEIYGLHPLDFVFDKDGSILPAVGFTDIRSAYCDWCADADDEDIDGDSDDYEVDVIYHHSL